MRQLIDRQAELAKLPHVKDLARIDVRLGPRFGWRYALIYERTDHHDPPPGSPAHRNPELYPHARDPVGLELCIFGSLPTRFQYAKVVLVTYDHLRFAGEWTLTYGAPFHQSAPLDGTPFPGWHRLDYTVWRPMGHYPEIYADHPRHPVLLANYGRLVSVDHVIEHWSTL